MVHTSLSSRCNAVTVAGSPAVTALLRKVAPATIATTAPSVVAGLLHTLPGPSRSRSGRADPVSRRHGSHVARTPAAAVPQHRSSVPASPGPGRSLSAFHSLLFYTPNWRACESSSAQALLARGPARAMEQLPQCALQHSINGIGTTISTSTWRVLNGGGWRPSYSWPPMLLRPKCDSVSERTWWSGASFLTLLSRGKVVG
jgi:hypothetical protein